MSHVTDPSCLDMIARVSRVSRASSSVRRDSECGLTNDLPSGYKNGSTPRAPTHAVDAHNPPLGDADCALLEVSKTSLNETRISLADPRWAGLVVHSMVIGFVSTVLPLTVYPFLTAYLNMEGTQTLSARTLLALPWFSRPFFRIFMDCVPLVFGRHHRPYMVLGWMITSVSLGAIYFIDIPEPFYGDHTLVGKPQAAMDAHQLASLNFSAPSHGAVYIMLMTVATFGYVLADVAADALVAETATRHFPPPHVGHESPFVPRVTMQRYAAMLVSFLFMGIGMSGWHYGGDFDFTLSYNAAMLVTAVVASLPIPFTWLMIEEAPCERQSFVACFRLIWGLFQNHAVAYVIACRFLGGVFGGISATPVNPIALYWAGVQPLNDNVVSFVSTAVVIGFVMLADKRGWTINYRLLIVGANIVILVLDCGATLFTIWDVVRSQWLWIGLPVMEALPSGLDYVIVTVILGEIAEPGTEELMRSVVTAVSFLATPFALTLTKYIDALFDVSNDDLSRDTTRVRTHATGVFLIAHVCQLLSVAWLFALPRGGDEAREWKQRSGSSARVGALLVAVLMISLAWSVAVHVLSVIAATSCLWIAGGKGCD